MEKERKHTGTLIAILLIIILLLLSLVGYFIYNDYYLKEDTKESTTEAETVAEFRSYVQTLDNNKIESVSLAKNRLLNIAKNQELSAEFLEEFEEFMNNVESNLVPEETSEEKLNTNGFLLQMSEGLYYIDINYQYLYETFNDKATKVKTDYYDLKSKIYDYADSNNIFEDAALKISWNEYREILILFDNYLKKHSETIEPQEEFNNLFEFYIGNEIIDNTPIYDGNGKLKEEVKESYKFLLENNKDFTRYEEVKAHYEKYL